MARILIATDFSTRSDRALRRAYLVARKTHSAMTLVHVVDADLVDHMIEADRAAASAVLEDTVATMRNIDGITADWIVKVEDVHQGILYAAGEISADLLVIGPHRQRIRDVFVGTTVERLIAQSMCPTLVAVETPAAPHRKTLLALDFEEASKAAARHALEIGIFESTEVVVMHAFDALGEGMMRRALEREEAVDRYVDTERERLAVKLQALIDEIGLPPNCQTVVTRGSPARTILEAAKEVGSDLIVLGTNQRKGLERALLGSVTADVIRDAHRDILIVPVDETA